MLFPVGSRLCVALVPEMHGKSPFLALQYVFHQALPHCKNVVANPCVTRTQALCCNTRGV